MLESPCTDPVIWRNLLAAATATICCLRPSEGAMLQRCDLWLDWDCKDAQQADLSFRGTAALNIMSRKNDQLRKGHHPRLGKSLDPRRDVVHQLLGYTSAVGLGLSPRCNKRQEPSARCQHCPPLFPVFERPTKTGLHISRVPPAPTQFSNMILAGLAHIGLDAKEFSGVCARRGGLSTAIAAGVPEHILWMQSGHAQDKAARRYVQLTNTNQLFDTFRAFDL